jgi:hypothetical protein
MHPLSVGTPTFRNVSAAFKLHVKRKQNKIHIPYQILSKLVKCFLGDKHTDGRTDMTLTLCLPFAIRVKNAQKALHWFFMHTNHVYRFATEY